MSAAGPDVAAFLDLLPDAFPERPRPAMIMAPSSDPADAAEGERIFGGEAPLEDLVHQSDLLHFMTKDALHWALPDLMRMCVRIPDLGRDVQETLRFMFLKETRQRFPEHWAPLDALTTGPQRAALKAFFALYARLDAGGSSPVDELVV